VADALRSQHPIDRLIREIIATRRPVLTDEIDRIVDRIATAPFDPQLDVPVRMKHRGLAYMGHVLGSRASSLVYHLVKRVVVERQWAFGTSTAEYLADLREAVRSEGARVVVYERRGGNMAAIHTHNRVPQGRLGPGALPWILVVFSADRGTIVSGYHMSSDTPENVPASGLWLK
jgi:hypothetical protein